MIKKNTSKLLQLSFDIDGIDPDIILEWLDLTLHIQAVMIKKPGQKTQAQIYLQDRQMVDQIKQQLFKLSSHLFSNFSEQYIPEQNWDKRWKKGLKKIIISKKLIISPRWIHHQKSTKKPVVTIDPGMAFGTGYHPTTHMCLEWIVAHSGEWTQICDIGCGSGILAIGALKCGAKYATALDKDLDAISAAKHNSQLNGFSGRINILHCSVKSIKVEQPFDCVFANLTAHVVRQQWYHISPLVRPGQGMLIIAGIHQTQLAWFDAWLRRKTRWTILGTNNDTEWSGYLLKRSKAT
ncbi:MAG: 50S ribosomal protein L11 methyltransferase [Chlamydiota bacterium]|nr:50S ribosomal protein L11 methyltransferase [Chlamydiota bacterium]